MPEFPSGVVTFLFTDVEGSTRRWEHDPAAMLHAVQRHFTLLDDAIAAHRGVRYKTIGDAIQAAFPTAPDALRAAVAAQSAIVAANWGSVGPLAVRMALHTGTAEPRGGDYLAPALNRLARLLTAAAGGQILVTEATRNLVRDALPDGVQLRDLGEHRLRDLREPERVFQVVAEGLPSRFPPLQSADRPLHNLPAQATAFVGRAREIAAVQGLLAAPGVRLATLTGPGGTGKTRLALRVAEELLPAYPDGVWFVPLAPVAAAENVAAAIAEALGVREAPGETLADSLRDFVRSRRLLLVLDNFEHVVAAAPLVASLLAGAEGLRVLATSRAPLRISGEREVPLLPLSLPAATDRIGPTEALAAEAVQLFVDRARAVRPDFTLTAQNAAAVAAICRRLDGLPLAIELAAARIRLLPPDAILARLDHRLALLTGGGRDLPRRQQTLRAAIAWSHDLLDAAEQALFRRLAVFVAGFTLDAAEAVANAAGGPDLPVLDCLAALQENSLIRRADDEEAGAAPDPRFAMLETIREFALECLAASDDLAATRAAHAAYFARLAADAAPRLTAGGARAWLDQLEAEHDNLRAALAWLRETGDAPRAVRLAGSLWRFWWLRGRIGEGRAELEAALALPAADDPADAARAAALDGAGVLAETQGDYARAHALHEQALALSRAAADRAGIARALGNLGVVAFDRQDDAAAESLLNQSLALAREIGDDALVATALNDLGRVAFERGDLTEAEALYQESLALRRRIGNDSDIARALNNLGGVALAMADFAAAGRLFAESLDRYRAAGDRWGAAGALTGLALATRSQGDAAAATAMFEESLDLFRESGDARNGALTLLGLADTEKTIGDLAASAAHYREAIAGFAALRHPAGVAEGLAGLAGVLLREGAPDRAARLLAAAAAHQGAETLAAEPYATDVAAARRALGEARFTAFWAEGAALSLADAVAEASASRAAPSPRP